MSAGGDKQRALGDHWSHNEVDQAAFKDARLGRRFSDLLCRLSDRMGGTIPLACQDWAGTKAAYRFFSNPKVEEGEILSGHMAATKARYAASEGPILVLQDTTEFTYQRRNPHDIGFTKSVNSGRDKDGRLRHHAVCGILMHSSLVVTEEGLPLGLAAVKFWNRDKFKGTAQLERKINRTRIPIEAKESVRWLDNLRQSVALLGQPDRCVHVGDRESDIYELYCLAKNLGTHFVVRTVVDRLAGDGDHTVKSEMHEAPSAGTHSIDVRVDDDTIERVTLDIRYKRIHVRPPIGKQKRYPELDLTVIHALEVGVPSGRKPILWKLVTDLEVADLDAAIEKIRWCSLRWKIEVFHKILKSGCRAEDAKLRTADRLTNLVALFCIVSWRVLWMTMMARTVPEASPTIVFTATEITILDRIIADSGNRGAKPGTLQLYLNKLSRLGGYLSRMSDPPPGNTVVWRGLRRLIDIQIGAELATYG
ncbi:transposase [Sphingobium sp. 22B]|uniref:IS4 family transposase n=1 Tax=unclassified Sphingobium TaxID=2611147 RepID=UPI000780EE37|nr:MULTISPECIES: IS4 family transposase [unclassified Sphingobium]KXU29599.1 transposase [Sphingobium sp. AM]KYC29889.1 transposase [Sphingobium sp. 22B]OAP31586.1 transposase [Sphingobium sp. 20006FA]